MATGVNSAHPTTTETTNQLSIIGFILAFILPPAGLICSIIGLRRSSRLNGKGQRLSIAGIVVSLVVVVIQILTVFLVIAGIGSKPLSLTTFRNDTLGYSVKYPTGWNIAHEAVGGTKGVVITNDYNHTGKVSGQIEVVYITAPANGYSQDVLKVISDSIKKNNKGTVVSYENRGLKNGLNALTLTTTYDGDNVRVKAKTTIVLKKDNTIYIVSTQAPEANWSRYETSFDDIHNTFSLI